MRFFFHRDHLLILLGAFVLLGLLRFLTFNVSFLNPVARALDAYSLSDLYFEIQHYGKEPAASDAIAIVDVTDCSDRGELALLLERIAHPDQEPKVMILPVHLFDEGTTAPPVSG